MEDVYGIILSFVFHTIDSMDMVILWKYTEKRSRRRKIVFIVFYVLLCFFVAFRSNDVGADTSNYLYHYSRISMLEYKDLKLYGYEIGFVILVKLISTIFHTYEAYKVLIALIGTSAAAYFYCKKSNSPMSTIMMLATFGDLFGNFSGGRQTITTAIILFSFVFVERKRIIKFVISVIFAGLFHNSAWFALLLYPAYHIKLPRKMTPLLLLPIGILFVFRGGIFTMMLRFANTKYLDAYGQLSHTGAYSTFLFFLTLSLFAIFLIYGGTEETYTVGLINT